MILVENIQVAGAHQALLPTTSFRVRPGELMLVAANTPIASTTASLVLTGRMRPDEGQVQLRGSQARATAAGRQLGHEFLRKHTALVDSPGITEPERFFKVSGFVSQELALLPGRQHSKSWLKENHFDALAGRWIDQLTVAERLELVTALAVTDSQVRALVYDAPDRHGHPETWLDTLQQLHSIHHLTTLVFVSSIPHAWAGPYAALGDTQPGSEKQE